MQFWQDGSILTPLLIACLLFSVGLSKHLLPILNASRIPSCIIAGCLGLLMGPQLLGVLPFQVAVLESIVYHGLAIVFICIGLQETSRKKTTDAVSFAFGLPFVCGLQAMVGIGAVLLFTGFNRYLHPGFGFLLPVGYSQGPGQALALGAAWETAGLTNGAQLGIIFASLGFFWVIVLGIPIIHLSQKNGWLSPVSTEEVEPEEEQKEEIDGSFNGLRTQVGIISGVYLLTYVLLYVLTKDHPPTDQLAQMVWGFHFVIALLLALGVGRLCRKLPHNPLRKQSLKEITNFSVDMLTCSALAAIHIDVFLQHWQVILGISLVAVVLTFLFILWASSRCFTQDRFQHAILWFGSSIGTLPMGLALLRIVDPKLQSSAPMSATIANAITPILFAPLLLGIVPYGVTHWGSGEPMFYASLLGMIAVYLAALLFLWRRCTAFRFVAWRRLWR